jgi:cytochrome c biogenesis protein CcdA/thiol-disulfide isomerase/thioredoxin
MYTEILSLVLAFIEGFALIISPCILPILPIILTGSLTGSKARPFGIIIGFAVTFSIVTLFSRYLIQLTHINPDTLRDASFILLLLLGIIMLSTTLSDAFTRLTQRLTNVGSNIKTVNNNEGGFLGGFIFGGLVGIIWTPCAGPILAAVIVQVAIQKTTLLSILTIFAFALGAGLPMLLIALIGRKMMTKFHLFRDHASLCRKLLGLIIILSVLFLAYSSGAVSAPIVSVNHDRPLPSGTQLINGLSSPYPAPAIAGIDAWINSPPLQLSQLKGNVVLIDFWTYSCINCIRTLPYLKDWYAKYHDKGLVIIGIHTPEFEFEKNLDNVKMAVSKDKIHYPVALDNQFTTWQNFNNHYWPAHYLINKDGEVVYQHFGEGDYDVTESNIRYLLGLTAEKTQAAPEVGSTTAITPETYLGYARAQNSWSPQAVQRNTFATYSYPNILLDGAWALNGVWSVYPDKIVANGIGASIKIHFKASDVYAVMGTTGSTVTVTATLNGEPLVAKGGKDVKNNQIEVSHHQLYWLIHFKEPKEGELELKATTPGLEIYTFTFGS